MLSKIIPPILGWVIGYFTNWLAIKMLFLPRGPKYIGSFKIPFTPGIIPKERERLSANIAKVCQENILNKETIKENLFTKNSKKKIYLLIEQGFNNLIEKDFTISYILEITKQDPIKLKKKIFDYLHTYLNDENNIEIFSKFLVQKLIEFFKDTDDYENIKQHLNKIIFKLLYNEDFIFIFLNRKVDEVISSENLEKIKFIIFRNMPKVLNFLANELDNNDNINQKFKQIITKILDENVNGFVGAFLNYDKIYISIKKSLIKSIKNVENQNLIALKIFKNISIYQNKKIIEIFEKFPLELQQVIKEKFNKNSIENLESVFIKYFDGLNLYTLIENNIHDFEKYLYQWIKNFIRDIFNEKLLIFLKNITDENEKKILDLKINIFLNKLDLSKYENKVYYYLETFFEKQGDMLLSQVDIYSMVKNKIDSFDNYTIENIVTSVVKKEFYSITLLGGILGFIIGLISLLYT